MNYQGRYPNNNSYKKTEEPKRIKIPLSEKYNDKKELYLPEGIAYKYAQKMKDISSHQLRKILNQTKVAVRETRISESNFTKARNTLFAMVPLCAYNAGRDRNLKTIYDFVSEHITEKSIVEMKDIYIFDELFTSVVAYHKQFSKNK